MTEIFQEMHPLTGMALATLVTLIILRLSYLDERSKAEYGEYVPPISKASMKFAVVFLGLFYVGWIFVWIDDYELHPIVPASMLLLAVVALAFALNPPSWIKTRVDALRREFDAWLERIGVEKPMDQTIKKHWINALKSGHYKYGCEVLKCILRDDTVAHSPLGVLCELALRSGVRLPVEENDFSLFRPYLHKSTFLFGEEQCEFELPEEVVRWSGLQSSNPVIQYSIEGRSTCMLSELTNRYDHSFSEIADLIEKHL